VADSQPNRDELQETDNINICYEAHQALGNPGYPVDPELNRRNGKTRKTRVYLWPLSSFQFIPFPPLRKSSDN